MLNEGEIPSPFSGPGYARMTLAFCRPRRNNEPSRDGGMDVRFLGVGKYNDLGSLYLRLMQAGHEVKVSIEDEETADSLGGMIDRIDGWERELDWVRVAGRDGVIIFESTGYGALADDLRRQGVSVIGGSAFGDRLEDDRAFGQEAMRDAGLRVAENRAFNDFDAGIEFVRKNPGRYVFKLSGGGYAPGHTFASELPDGRDMIAILEAQKNQWTDERPSFVLMQHLIGVEIGTGAYFNGRRFLRPACLDWEHKRFFPGDLGEMTGEMGTLVTYRGSDALFEATLGKLETPLREAGHVGYVNINTIVNEDGIFPLEFTCRFGYPGFAILEPLQTGGWDDLFRRMLDPESADFPTADGFCVGVVITIPPYPHQGDPAQVKGLPVLFREEPGAEDRRNIHFCDVAQKDGILVTSGVAGYVMLVTGCGSSVEDAQADAYRRVRNVVVPKMRYRIDIGDRFLRTDRRALQRLGLLPE